MCACTTAGALGRAGGGAAAAGAAATREAAAQQLALRTEYLRRDSGHSARQRLPARLEQPIWAAMLRDREAYPMTLATRAQTRAPTTHSCWRSSRRQSTCSLSSVHRHSPTRLRQTQTRGHQRRLLDAAEVLQRWREAQVLYWHATSRRIAVVVSSHNGLKCTHVD